MKVPEVPVAELPPLRDYQRDLLQAASHYDSIVYLETGMGKTRIALEVIAKDLPSLRGAGQVAILLAPSVPLVRQQADVLASAPTTMANAATGNNAHGSTGALPTHAVVKDCRRSSEEATRHVDQRHEEAVAATTEAATAPPTHASGGTNKARGAANPPAGEGGGTGTKARAGSGGDRGAGAAALLRVACLSSNSSYGSWGQQRWAEVLKRVDVLVCTPALLLGALVNAFIRVSDIGLIVVDEAHHCHEQHPYAVLMREFIGRRSGPTALPATNEPDTSNPTVADNDTATGAAMEVVESGGRSGGADCADGSGTDGPAAGGDGGRGHSSCSQLPAKPRLRPRILGLTASPLTPIALQSNMAGGRLITSLERSTAAAGPSRPKAQIHWVGPGASLPPPPPQPLPDNVPTRDPHQVVQEYQAAADLAAAQSQQLVDALVFCKELLQLAQRVMEQRDRLQRLQHLGELSLEQLGLSAETVPAALQSALLDRCLGQVAITRDEFDASLRDIRMLKSQVLSLEAALHDLGPWPMAALAAGDLFASSQTDSMQGKNPDEVAEGELQKMLEPTDLGPPPSANMARELIMDMLELHRGIDSVGLPQMPDRGAASLGERLACSVLSLIMEGLLMLLVPHKRAEAEHIARGFGMALFRMGGWTSWGRGVLEPWAREMLGLVPTEVLQEQVLGVVPDPGSSSHSEWPLKLVTHRVCWLLRQLHRKAYDAGAGPGARASCSGQQEAPATPWSAMVFCDRKSTCEALCWLIEALPAVRGLLRPAVFVGSTSTKSRNGRGTGQKRQEQTRQEFGSGKLNLLLSTSVGAEGLDFSHCALVAALDLPKHVTPFVQSGGRARAKGGEHWLLVRSPEEEEKARALLQAEQRMLLQAHSLASANFRNITTEGAAAVPSSVPPMALEALDGEEVKDSNDDPDATASYWESEPGDEVVLEVPSTGARLPAVWAVNMLLQLCYQLPGNDGCTVLQPMFRWRSLGPGAHNPGYTYRVFLPANLGMEPVDGPMCDTKSLAKKLASLEAIRQLWKRGDLDDHLRLKVTRRTATRAAHAAAFGGFLYSIPRATLLHRLPQNLRPGCCERLYEGSGDQPPSAVAITPMGSAAGGSTVAAATSPPGRTYHLYMFVMRPKNPETAWSGLTSIGAASRPPISLETGLLHCPAWAPFFTQLDDLLYGVTESQGAAAATAASADSKAAAAAATMPVAGHSWGVLVHGPLPKLPAFDLYISDGAKGEVLVQATAVPLGTLPAGPYVHAVLSALGHVLARMEAAPCPAAAVREVIRATATAAGKALPFRRPSPQDFDAWSEWVGFRRLHSALEDLLRRRSAAVQGGREGAQESGSSVGDCPEGGGEGEEPAGGPDVCWWAPVPVHLPGWEEAEKPQCSTGARKGALDGQGDVIMDEESNGGTGGSSGAGSAAAAVATPEASSEADVVASQADAAELELAAARDCGDAEAVYYIDWGVVRQLSKAPTPVVEIPSPSTESAVTAPAGDSRVISLTSFEALAANEQPPSSTAVQAEAPLQRSAAADVSSTNGATTAMEARAAARVSPSGVAAEVPPPLPPPLVPLGSSVKCRVLQHKLIMSLNTFRLCVAREPTAEELTSFRSSGPSGGADGHTGADGNVAPGGGSSTVKCDGSPIELMVQELSSYGRGRRDRLHSRLGHPGGGNGGGVGAKGDGTNCDGGGDSACPAVQPPGMDVSGSGALGASPTASDRPETEGLGVDGAAVSSQHRNLVQEDDAMDGGGREDAVAVCPSDPPGASARRSAFREVVPLNPQRVALYPLDLARWRLFQGLFTIMWRVEGLVAAADYLDNTLSPANFKPACLEPEVREKRLLLAATALTSPAALDPLFNNDRLEYLGDAVLKMLAHVYVYLRERDVLTSHEGVLSFMRDSYVANEVLAGHALGPRLGLAAVLRALPFEHPRAVRQAHLIRYEEDDGSPVLHRKVDIGSATSIATREAVVAAAGGGKPTKATTSKKQKARAPKQRGDVVTRVLTGVNGKRLADCVEALIGSHLLPALDTPRGSRHTSRAVFTCNRDVQLAIFDALSFCTGVGLLPEDAVRVILEGFDQVAPVCAAEQKRRAAAATNTADSNNHIDGVGATSLRERSLAEMPTTLQRSVLAVEGILGHTFKHPSLCVQALTHVNHPRASSCGGGYQRVEFLGDGVLGMVTSLWAFREGGSAQCMTDRRSALVSNGPLAAAAVRRTLHLHMRTGSSGLVAAVKNFAEMYKAAVVRFGSPAAVNVTTAERAAKNKRTERRQKESKNVDPVHGQPSADEEYTIRAPKALADVVEALVGAVYLDTGGDLGAAERVVANIMLD
ncbi:hypothetical protein Vafri_19918 [Volvox africanus]|uniref:Uncharacterized protein n=1 Tax=Volvox africanus TaxID=51714 RepID=A0A8J4FA67_9CHLO|nr:hypothetical protein Vafri_19918 [Volvox africanus]